MTLAPEAFANSQRVEICGADWRIRRVNYNADSCYVHPLAYQAQLTAHLKLRPGLADEWHGERIQQSVTDAKKFVERMLNAG